jgi:hypothetical protein
LQHFVHIGHDVLPVDNQLGVDRQPQRRVQAPRGSPRC